MESPWRLELFVAGSRFQADLGPKTLVVCLGHILHVCGVLTVAVHKRAMYKMDAVEARCSLAKIESDNNSTGQQLHTLFVPATK